MDASLEMVCGAGNNLICCGGRAWLLYLLVKTVRGRRDTVKRCPPKCLTVNICIQNEVCGGNASLPWRYVVDVDGRAWL